VETAVTHTRNGRFLLPSRRRRYRKDSTLFALAHLPSQNLLAYTFHRQLERFHPLCLIVYCPLKLISNGQTLHSFGHVPCGSVPNPPERKRKERVSQAEYSLQVELRLIGEAGLRTLGCKGDAIAVA